MKDLRKLKDEAAGLAAKGKLGKAADLYREAARVDPGDLGTRHKLAEVLRRAGRIPEAIQAYREVADRFAKDGLLIKAIAISKAILDLDPQHVETQGALAELYSRRAAVEGRPPPRATAGMAAAEAAPPAPSWRPQPPLEVPTPLARIVRAAGAALEAGLVEDVVVEVELQIEAAPGPRPGIPIEPEPRPVPVLHATRAAAPLRGEEPAPRIASAQASSAATGPSLPRVPIFSDLSRDAFLALTRGMVFHRVPEGEAVIREGDEGTSFYVVATGRLAVSKRSEAAGPVVLARLGEGDFFGEMALLSGTRRTATVTAEEDSEVLELPSDVLLDVAGRHPHLAQSLRRFYRQRLLANAMAMSPIFRPFQREDRKAIMERFRAREVAPGEAVIHEGERSDGLYVVIEGAMDVVKRKGGGEVVVGQLREGDVFGEMSCLRKAPASASVLVRRAGTLLRLPRTAFDELVVSHPQILEVVAELEEERSESLDAILSGHAQWTDDGLVLI